MNWFRSATPETLPAFIPTVLWIGNIRNVYQWNDLNGEAGASRGVAGGFWFGGPTSALNTTLASQTVAYEGNDTGFRLAAPIPEPSTCLLLGIGLAGSLVHRHRRNREKMTFLK